MGLTNWKGLKVRKCDVTVAKNYLNETEIRNLNRIITMYLDYAEMQAEQKQPVYMSEWKEKLDAFLTFNQQEILNDSGSVPMEIARRLALEEYDKFSLQRLENDAVIPDTEFEKISKQIEQKKHD
jgi:hypothetical protein